MTSRGAASAEAVLVLCTAPVVADAPGRLGADDLARALVDERLCACVNLLPGVRSWFRWQERTQVADEVQLLLKTTRAALPALARRLTALHPYEVPELLEVPVQGGSAAYLAWLAAAVAPREA